MSGDIFRQNSMDEKVCITQYEQKEYDSCSWENEEFGKRFRESYNFLGLLIFALSSLILC